MQPPDALIQKGITSLPCIGDGRQSGTSGSPSILHASPEAAAAGGLALLRTGDRVRFDLGRRSANILVSSAELEARRSAAGTFPIPQIQTPCRKSIGERWDNWIRAPALILRPALSTLSRGTANRVTHIRGGR